MVLTISVNFCHWVSLFPKFHKSNVEPDIGQLGLWHTRQILTVAEATGVKYWPGDNVGANCACHVSHIGEIQREKMNEKTCLEASLPLWLRGKSQLMFVSASIPFFPFFLNFTLWGLGGLLSQLQCITRGVFFFFWVSILSPSCVWNLLFSTIMVIVRQCECLVCMILPHAWFLQYVFPSVVICPVPCSLKGRKEAGHLEYYLIWGGKGPETLALGRLQDSLGLGESYGKW